MKLKNSKKFFKVFENQIFYWCFKWNRCFNFGSKSNKYKKGDHIITTSHTAFATISAIVETGAVPVFVDIKEEDFTINTTELIKKITKKTKAIIAVHIYGNPADIKEISKIAKRKNCIN